MARESKFEIIARERGKGDVETMLVDQLNESGSIEKAAADLGITYRHVFRKYQELGIKKEIQFYPSSRYRNAEPQKATP